ncbi:MAG: hypothetical protein ACP5O4_04125 [bacterium]|jgi:type II secretory pathway pseudopilin PulG
MIINKIIPNKINKNIKKRGITLIEILVVVGLSVSTLFLVIEGLTNLVVSTYRQTEYLNCLSIAKSYMEVYSYLPRGQAAGQRNFQHNVGTLSYTVSISIQDNGNYTNNLGLRRLIIVVESPRIRSGNRNLQVRLESFI